MSAFDANTFLNATLAPSATEQKPVPTGLYPAAITKVEVKTGEAGPNAKTPGAPWARLDVTWDIQDEHLRTSLNRSAVIVVQGIMLDITPEGQIATGDGNNIRLGKLRKALGKNSGQESFLSFVGCQAKVEISHRPWNDTIQTEVKSVTMA
jgi:hypothetical protein